jgi:hypothetical protein
MVCTNPTESVMMPITKLSPRLTRTYCRTLQSICAQLCLLKDHMTSPVLTNVVLSLSECPDGDATFWDASPVWHSTKTIVRTIPARKLPRRKRAACIEIKLRSLPDWYLRRLDLTGFVLDDMPQQILPLARYTVWSWLLFPSFTAFRKSSV